MPFQEFVFRRINYFALTSTFISHFLCMLLQHPLCCRPDWSRRCINERRWTAHCGRAEQTCMQCKVRVSYKNIYCHFMSISARVPELKPVCHFCKICSADLWNISMTQTHTNKRKTTTKTTTKKTLLPFYSFWVTIKYMSTNKKLSFNWESHKKFRINNFCSRSYHQFVTLNAPIHLDKNNRRHISAQLFFYSVFIELLASPSSRWSVSIAW